MDKTKQNVGRAAVYLGVIGAMAVSLVPATARNASAQGTTRKIGNFDVAARFLEVWNKQGNDQANTYVNGLPITARRAEISTEDGKTYDTQWFERAKYEAHPENKAPYDVLLGRLGANFVEGRGSVDPATNKVRNAADAAFVGIDKPADANGTSKVWFQETKHSVTGKILEYWNKYGGLQQFGFPLSEAFNEVSTDGKTYSTQYFERAKFEVHPEKADPYAVELGLLGVQQYKATPIAADKLPIAPPAGVTSAKDTYTGGSLQEPDTMFCNEANTVVAVRFCAAVTFNDQLVTFDEKENAFPLAAWYVPTVENGGSFFVGSGGDQHLVTKYKLRKGVKWSDGTELTSNDAVFSFKLILDDPLSVSTSVQTKVTVVDNPDKYTVVYNWMSLNQAKAKFADPKTNKVQFAFLQSFIDQSKPVVDIGYYLIGSVHEKKNLGNVPIDKIQESTEGTKPSGYGPFMVQDWKQGDQMTLVANPNYNLTAPPLLKRIIQKFNTDVNANINAFLTGNLDAIESEGFVVPPEQSPQIKAAGGVVANVPASTIEHLDFRMDWGPFTDRAVREAMITGINRKQVVDVVYKGAGSVANSPTPPILWHSLENPDFAKNFPDVAAKYKLPIYTYDAAKANQILDAAGWVKGPDGIRAKNGQKLSFEYATTRNSTRQAVQALVSNDLKAIGIDAQVVNYPTGFFNEDGPISTGQCKLCEFGSSWGSLDSYISWTTSEINTEAKPGGQNKQHYSNATLDASNTGFESELDRAKAAAFSAASQQQLMNDIVLIPLVQRANIEIYTAKQMNRKTTNTKWPQWWNVSQWYFVK
ncbi:MAG: peptide ABC transporter substrate-binding protein [Chloroflexota bacterium]